MENNIVIEVSRNVSADNPQSRIPGDLAALSIKINGEDKQMLPFSKSTFYYFF